MAYPTNCPFCKKGNLDVFDKTPTTATLACSNCDRLVTSQTTMGKFLDAAVPTVSILVSLVTIAAFFGITDFGKIREWFNSHKN